MSASQSYLQYMEESMFKQVQTVSKRLHDIADDVARIGTDAKNEKSTYKIEGMPGRVIHSVAWGVANLSLDQLASALAELIDAREAQKALDAKDAKDALAAGGRE